MRRWDGEKKTNHSRQLTLPVSLSHDARFENYFGEANLKSIALLQRELKKRHETLFYIVGQADVGKTHFAYATMQYLEDLGCTACYLAMDELSKIDTPLSKPETLFEGLDRYDLLVLDNVDVWLNSVERELALFNLFNRFKISGQQLLVTASSVPSRLDLKLADLSSRLKSGLLLTLVALSDDEKEKVLRDFAKQKGLVLAGDVSAFIIRRGGRTMTALISVMDILDQASLVEQRRLTVPFVKQVLHW